jgi:alkanesulfonate monooxygenase SsuD/methylene tetrahydromethanopterin reductase-like flavin-dependent oxidoreductase (luciferase family)
MRYGLAIDLGSDSVALSDRLDATVPLLRRAEPLGFEAVSFGELYPTGPGYFHAPSPLLSLAALAPRTNLQLCTGVTLLTAWSPLRLAYESAVLDQLSQGRFVLGAATGGPPTWSRFGVAKEGLSQRLDETLAALRALWSGSDGFDGEYVKIEGGIRPLPVQPGGPPIWLGGLVPRVLRRAAAFADGWYASSNYRLDRQIEPTIERYRAAAAAASAANADVIVNRLCVVAPTEAEAMRIAKRYVEPLLAIYAGFGGLTDADGELLRPDDDLLASLRGELTLIGTPEDVGQQLERYSACGVTHMQLRVQPSDMPAELAQQTIDLLGENVLSSPDR